MARVSTIRIKNERAEGDVRQNSDRLDEVVDELKKIGNVLSKAEKLGSSGLGGSLGLAGLLRGGSAGGVFGGLIAAILAARGMGQYVEDKTGVQSEMVQAAPLAAVNPMVGLTTMMSQVDVSKLPEEVQAVWQGVIDTVKSILGIVGEEEKEESEVLKKQREEKEIRDAINKKLMERLRRLGGEYTPSRALSAGLGPISEQTYNNILQDERDKINQLQAFLAGLPSAIPGMEGVYGRNR